MLAPGSMEEGLRSFPMLRSRLVKFDLNPWILSCSALRNPAYLFIFHDVSEFKPLNKSGNIQIRTPGCMPLYTRSLSVHG
jgi:hypothetical protein